MFNVRKSKNLIVLALWIASVLMFATVYWGFWKTKPDAFIVNREFNLTPYSSLVARLWPEDTTQSWGKVAQQTTSSIDLDELTREINNLDAEATNAIKQIAGVSTRQKQLEGENRLHYQKHSDLLWDNVRKFQIKETQQTDDDVRAAELELNQLEELSARQPSSNLAIAVANSKVKVAQASYQAAVKRAETGEYILKNLRNLADPSTTAKMDSLQEQIASASGLHNELSDQLRKIRSKAYDRQQEWYLARTSRLDWLDFLYFSIGVSTTTTFGDIVPNIRAVRMVVLLQLIGSIFIVGYLVNSSISRQPPPAV